MQAIYIFDYSKITAGEYGDYVFKFVTQSLAGSKGTCRFNHGDGSRLNAKELAGHARASNGRVLQAKAVSAATPLTDPTSEFTGGIYFVGLWTDGEENLDTLHNAFDQPNVEGYIGMMEVKDLRFTPENWNYLMRQQLHLPPKMVLYNGSRCG